jgi:dienelactone hydrolase
MRKGSLIASSSGVCLSIALLFGPIPAAGDLGSINTLRTATSEDSRIVAEGQSLRERLRARFGKGGRTSDAWETRARQSGADVVVVSGRSVAVWRPQAAQQRAAPLILFSHGFHGCATQSTFLTAALAEHGYLVVAPVHADASCDKDGDASLASPPEKRFRDYENWTDEIYRDRAQDIAAVIGGLKADAQWNARIDWSRVGLMGHSLGGYTVLGLAGAWPSWRLDGVKATLALSPYCQPFLVRGNLQGLQMPIMYQTGTRDLGVMPSVKKPGGCFDSTASPAYYVELKQAGHLAWTDLKQEHKESVIAYSLAFFDKFLAETNGADLASQRPDVAEMKSK